MLYEMPRHASERPPLKRWVLLRTHRAPPAIPPHLVRRHGLPWTLCERVFRLYKLQQNCALSAQPLRQQWDGPCPSLEEFMSWVTVIWSMVASACLTLAVIYFLVWCSNRPAWANLLFAMTAASTAAFTLCELRQMRAGTPGELLSAMRWTHVALLGVLVSTTWFVTFYLGAGRRWLAWTVSRPARVLPAGRVSDLGERQLPRDHESAARAVSRRLRHGVHRHTESMDAVRLRDDGADPHLCRGCQRHGLAARRAPKGADDRGQRRILSFARHRSGRAGPLGPTAHPRSHQPALPRPGRRDGLRVES